MTLSWEPSRTQISKHSRQIFVFHLKQIIIFFSINEQKVQNAQKLQRSLKSLDLPYEPFRLLSDRDRVSENRVSDKVNTNRKRAALCAKRKGTRNSMCILSIIHNLFCHVRVLKFQNCSYFCIKVTKYEYILVLLSRITHCFLDLIGQTITKILSKIILYRRQSFLALASNFFIDIFLNGIIVVQNLNRIFPRQVSIFSHLEPRL